MKIKQGYILQEIMGKYVIIPIDSDAELQGMIQMNHIGAFMWKALDTEKTREELIKSLLEEYDVQLEQVEKDVDVFINELSTNGVLEI